MLRKLMRKKTADIQLLDERIEAVKNRQIPNHVAIIMDGNGRWAKQRKMPRIAGHHEGMKTVRQITNFANAMGVKVLTLYAFSTENWKRPRMEIDFLMNLPGEFLTTYLPELMEKSIKVEMIGDMDALPKHTKKAIEKAMEQTKYNKGLILNFAMNYGSRVELVHAMKELVEEVAAGTLKVEEINESSIESKLMTAHLPEPDLLIRTSGEVRLSNFMLWQLAYAEFIFTDVLWPDYDEDCFLQAIEDFQKRNRRFGSLEGDQKR
ncbi:isoprenyl transferase [Sporosarcina sp. P21c]|uniref:isoprenyl transferase n=1 Tax=unclassified Sporosarcina TaxID=2647733 RepID=UPI000C164269|nr:MULTISPECIES: isoprenyl transferase [unclassified Sporosarcina]PIC68742.1 isoprenyl transferase [Sporosarcina sp. P16a]PIC91076.1 isoprenyl transferase [Sporosarcina sp. P21c]PIC93794.1 isoprenyl transferase [Sporosarcina sp. P25]